MKILTIGEAMVEFFREDDDRWRRGFAGDTLNTAWCLRAVLGPDQSVGFVSRIGTDAASDDLAAFIADAGIDTRGLARDDDRTLGLYTISTDATGERSFSYWRSASAARRMADDPGQLAQQLAGADLIYLTGITAAILDTRGRANLLDAIATAKASGARVAYDSNHRPKLWESVEATRDFARSIAALADILRPTFEDEALIFGDRTPAATLDRLSAHGANEIVLSNGSEPVRLVYEGIVAEVPLAAPVAPVDTTGAGDSFSGAYLAARAMDIPPEAAVRRAQSVARAVVSRRGALIPMDMIQAAFNA